MLSRLYNYYLLARESFFYIPALLCLFYGAMCLGVHYLEVNYTDRWKEIPLIYNGTATDALDFVKVLLSAMITMATVVISMTMVVLSLSASQMGPRMIRMFMSDRQTKTYIGLFFGSVVACFVLIGLLHDAPSEEALPRLTVSFVFILCFMNLFFLLAYVHHIARLSVADVLISKVHAQLMNAIHRLPADQGDKVLSSKERAALLPGGFLNKSKPVFGARSGYVQTVDYEQIAHMAEEEALVAEILFKAGDYLVEGKKLAYIYPPKKATPDFGKTITESIIYGETRTGSQDIEYSVRHLVEVGLRALSPGINDDYTAITVLNKLAASLALLFQKTLPQRIYKDKKGHLRLLASHVSEKDVIFEAFSTIRKAGERKPNILAHIIGLIADLYPLAIDEDEREGLDLQMELIKDHIENQFGANKEGEMLMQLHKKASTANKKLDDTA